MMRWKWIIPLASATAGFSAAINGTAALQNAGYIAHQVAGSTVVSII